MADQPRVLGRIGQEAGEHEHSGDGFMDDSRYANPSSAWSQHDWQHEFNFAKINVGRCFVNLFDLLVALFKLSWSNWRALVAALVGWTLARFVGMGFLWKTAAAIAAAFVVIAYETAQSMLGPGS